MKPALVRPGSPSEQRTAERTRTKGLAQVARTAQGLLVPALAAAYALHRFLKHRKEKKAQQPPASAAASKKAPAGKAKPRRDYKINREQYDSAEEAFAARQAQLASLQQAKADALLGPGDNVQEGYDEQEVGILGGADGDMEQSHFYKMLQQ